ncbi:MAG: hypothetical protein Q7J76_07420 [Candidatus Brocadiaceae bacterium]|uniref:hypothetical protein n=1 Tax=Candidatus Wunengus sp. YC61 TaxID=3367698 RepID=UPI00271F84E2|nr:hypothetical protein [Candidatus Brocadiaceae bacterium]
MKKICIIAVTSSFLLFLCVLSNLCGELLPKGHIDKISNSMSKAADVYYSAKSSAVETQKLLSGTATQETQQTQETSKTAKRSRLLDILKKIETAFLDAAMDGNNHK